MAFRFVGVAGLPRAGSTLLCQLLGAHPQIHCDGHSSPVCNALLNARHQMSDDSFFLARLDNEFRVTYERLRGAMQGFVHGWYAAQAGQSAVVIDKNRGWLAAIEFLLEIEPEARLIVPLRELGQIYGSIEAQHQRTQLIDFADHLADLDRFGRAERLFSRDKTLGAQLVALGALQDLPAGVRERICFVRFEELMRAPQEKMVTIFNWLGLEPLRIDFQKLPVRPHESDSHYRYKFTHRQSDHLCPPREHVIPRRIQASIEHGWSWYYRQFYPWVEPVESEEALLR